MEKVGKDFNHNNNEDSVEDCESSDSSGKVNKKKRVRYNLGLILYILYNKFIY